MSRAVLFLMSAVLLTGCGIKRPLVRPADIPEYERRQQQKRERYEDQPVVVQPQQPEI